MDAGFFYKKGWAQNELEKYQDAIESLKKSIAIDNTDEDAYSELGYAYYKVEQNDDAINCFRIVINLSDQKSSRAYKGLGDIYFENMKNYDSAMYYYEKSFALTTSNKLADYRLGWCYNDKDRWSDAITPLKAAIAADGDYNSARTELGYAYYKLKNYDDALTQFKPVMTSDAKNELSRYYAGFCYYLKDDQASLKRMIDELHALNSTTYVETLNKYVK